MNHCFKFPSCEYWEGPSSYTPNTYYGAQSVYGEYPSGQYSYGTITGPGRTPSYFSGNDLGGSIITPGYPASQYSTFGGQTTIITPGQPPVYIEQY